MKISQKELLEYEVNLLKKALDILKYSLNSCLEISNKEEYSYDELDRFECLTARFARLSDILTQKLFRLIDAIELEKPGTAWDVINRAEKRGIINNADEFAEIRELRNIISHEYMPEEIRRIYLRVLHLSPLLIKTSEDTVQYCKKYAF
jgi:uncharacterized protein YutE (UPF0331/DUF86 family)